MMRWRAVKQIALTSLREFIRTPEAVFWTYGFPLLMALALGLAFSTDRETKLPVVVEGLPQLVQQLEAEPKLEVAVAESGKGLAPFRRGKFLALLRAGSDGKPTLLVNSTQTDAAFAQVLVERVLQSPPQATPRIEPLRVERQEAPGSRYIDWLIPGLIGLNLLGAGMWGIGFNLVQMRVRHTLRRLMVTPMTKLEFLFSFMLSRLLLTVPDATVVVLFGWCVFDVPVRGSIWLILLIIALGGAAFMGLGILIASRARTTEAVSGMMNLVMLPMWLLGGSFFSNERFPEALQPVVQAMPLTHLNSALRTVMLEGQGISAVAFELGFLAVFGIICYALAIRIFRWS